MRARVALVGGDEGTMRTTTDSELLDGLEAARGQRAKIALRRELEGFTRHAARSWQSVARLSRAIKRRRESSRRAA